MSRTASPARTWITAAAITLVFGLAACSTGGQHVTRSGFISDYSNMRPAKKHKKDVVYVASDYDPGAYTMAAIEPVAWYGRHRDAETEAKLEQDFRERLTRSLADRYRIVEPGQAGPGVLRVRGAITGTRPGRWYYNLPAQAAQIALGGFGLFRPFSGGASEEMIVQDATSGKTLVQLATYRNGKPWHVSGSYVAYDHARGAFTQASKRLAELVRTPGSTIEAASLGQSAPTASLSRRIAPNAAPSADR